MITFGGYKCNDMWELDFGTKSAADMHAPQFRDNFVSVVYKDNLVVFEMPSENAASCYKQLRLKEASDGVELYHYMDSDDKTACSHNLSLVNNPTMSDVTFKVEDGQIFGHSAICMRYKYFQSVFLGEMQESRAKEIEILGVSRAIFLLMLEYVYSEQFSASGEIAVELFVAADRFGIESLKQLCKSEVVQSLTVETATAMLELSHQHNAEELKSECGEMITANFDAVSKTQAFQDLLLTSADLVFEPLRRHALLQERME